MELALCMVRARTLRGRALTAAECLRRPVIQRWPQLVHDRAYAAPWASSVIRMSPWVATSPSRVTAERTAGSWRWDGAMRAGLRAQPLAHAAMSGSALY